MLRRAANPTQSTQPITSHEPMGRFAWWTVYEAKAKRTRELAKNGHFATRGAFRSCITHGVVEWDAEFKDLRHWRLISEESTGGISISPRVYYPELSGGFDFDNVDCGGTKDAVKTELFPARCFAQMRLYCPERRKKRYCSAFSVVEVVIAAALIGMSVVSLVVAMTVGFAMVRSSREDVRATQIMLQKMETLRLYTWSQLQDNTYLVPNFTERFNPSATNGTLYYGTIAVTPTSGLPSGYSDSMRVVTVTVQWTNYVRAQPIPHERQMQTYVAQNGIQNYVY
jgi:hypothetical protein